MQTGGITQCPPGGIQIVAPMRTPKRATIVSAAHTVSGRVIARGTTATLRPGFPARTGPDRPDEVVAIEHHIYGTKSPLWYVPRLREKLNIDNDRWGRLCAEHALPLGWESMAYEEFLRDRRRSMADIIRVAFRQLGGESDAPPVTPPWFLPGAEAVWQRIAETERALRGVVRDVYLARFGDSAASRIEAAVPEGERQTLSRNLARRPAGADPLSIVDYLYLGQLPTILFASDAQQEARTRFSSAQDPKPRLLAAVSQIVPVRNEIAHVREIDRDRLLRATVACADILEMLKSKG